MTGQFGVVLAAMLHGEIAYSCQIFDFKLLWPTAPPPPATVLYCKSLAMNQAFSIVDNGRWEPEADMMQVSSYIEGLPLLTMGVVNSWKYAFVEHL